MGCVRTPILGRPRPLPGQRRAAHYTLNCEEPALSPDAPARGNRRTDGPRSRCRATVVGGHTFGVACRHANRGCPRVARVTAASALLLLDLAGTLVFALNGALTAIRATRLDIVGVLALGMITAVGGGIIRDVIIDSLPPATFRDWRYLVVAAAGALIAFAWGTKLDRLAFPIEVLDAVGLSLFAITGATKALDAGLGPVQAVILGAVTAVGGGTLRDVLIGRVPTVLSSGLYAIPALVGAGATVVGVEIGLHGWVPTLVAGAACFALRLVGIRFDLNAPVPPGPRGSEPA